MYVDRTIINRRNVTADPAKAYRADRDFFLVVMTSRVIAAAMEILGMQSKSCQKPSKCPIPSSIDKMNKQAKLRYLHKVAGLIVDSFVFDQTSTNHLVDKILTTQEKEDAIHSQ